MEEKINEQKQKIEQSKQEAKKDMQGFASSFKKFIRELLSIREETDKQGTVQIIKDNIAMKGHTAWILVFSILIASIGLNVSSTAVVIGAMLISPLMGPILGVGLSIGINDIDTLKRSMINLGVMLGLSLLTSFLFFLIPLFQEATPELLARTQPNVLDVMIAISGGLALIVAISRPSPQTNTVAGVAIATALMPPLCTAGFGLAIGNYGFFFGAMFLFLINTTFIALATFVIVKYLRFPMVKYINSTKRRNIAKFASFIAIIVLAGSVYTFYQLVLQKDFEKKSTTLMESIINENYSIIKKKFNYNEKTIDLTLFGKTVTDNDEKKWRDRVLEIGLQEDVILNIHKGKDDGKLMNEYQNLKEAVVNNQKIIDGRDAQLRNKDEKIQFLENERKKHLKNKIPFLKISEEAKINYEGLQEISFSQQLKTNFEKVDTLTVFNVKWFDSIPKNVVNLEVIKINKWLKTRLSLDTLLIIKE